MLGKLKGMANDHDNQALGTFVAAGYGGIAIASNPALTAQIDATFQQLVDFDTDLITIPKAIDQDFNNDGLIFQIPGIWSLNVYSAITFDEVNAGRQLIVRFYNVTTATPNPINFDFFVGRNQGGVNISMSTNFEIPDAVVGDIIGLQIGSIADTFTAPVNIGTILEATHISEAKFL